MEFFRGAKAVRLRGHHNKYLVVAEDEETVRQSSNGSSRNARWSVEFVEGKKNVIRLKSCYWNYLCASDKAYLTGLTGKKVVLASPRLKNDASVEWEPVKEGGYLKMRTRKGMFLRANGLMPPWKNSVTHDTPSRTATQDWVLWKIDVLEIDHSSEEVPSQVLAGQKLEKDKEEEGEEEEEVRSSASSSSPANWGGSYGGASPAGSVHSYRQAADPITRTTSAASSCESPTSNSTPRISPLVQRAINRTHQHSQSGSFSSLKSILDDVDKLLDGDSDADDHEETETPDLPSLAEPTSLEIRMAKQTLKELQDLEFRDVSSSGRFIRLEKALTLLCNTSDHDPRARSKVLNLQQRIQELKNKYDAASNNIRQYATFSAEKVAAKGELQKNAAQARELQTKEDECNNVLMAAYAKKDELLRQLEEVESTIQDAERAQAENSVGIEKLISVIGQQRESLKEMERKEKSWQLTRSVAERNLKQVEDYWAETKASFSCL